MTPTLLHVCYQVVQVVSIVMFEGKVVSKGIVVDYCEESLLMRAFDIYVGRDCVPLRLGHRKPRLANTRRPLVV